jgi:hypothetical protein
VRSKAAAESLRERGAMLFVMPASSKTREERHRAGRENAFVFNVGSEGRRTFAFRLVLRRADVAGARDSKSAVTALALLWPTRRSRRCRIFGAAVKRLDVRFVVWMSRSKWAE